MGGEADNRTDMERRADEKREILRRYVAETRTNKAAWAKAVGVSKNAIYNFLNGYSDALDDITYKKLARVHGIPMYRLTGETPEPASPTSIWVVGYVQAGMFREALEWDRAEWFEVDVPVPERFRGRAKALEVRGPSMNLEYPDGSIVVWVETLDFRPPRDGDHVIAYAHSSDDRIEATVKELRLVDGKSWLWPRSTDPAHQTPVDIGNPGGDVKSVEVKGIVLGGYRPRVI